MLTENGRKELEHLGLEALGSGWKISSVGIPFRYFISWKTCACSMPQVYHLSTREKCKPARGMVARIKWLSTYKALQQFLDVVGDRWYHIVALFDSLKQKVCFVHGKRPDKYKRWKYGMFYPEMEMRGPSSSSNRIHVAAIQSARLGWWKASGPNCIPEAVLFWPVCVLKSQGKSPNLWPLVPVQTDRINSDQGHGGPRKWSFYKNSSR